MTDDISSVVGKIYSRIFDHRPFLQGEITFFIKEFQEKRGDKEVENLFSVSQTTSELNAVKIVKCKSLAESSLDNLKEELSKTLHECNCILTRNQQDPLVLEALENNREVRNKFWEDFNRDMQHKRERIDNTFEEKEEEITDFYFDLERKLHIHK